MTVRAAEKTDDWAALDGAVRRWLARRAPADQVDDLAQETLLRVHRTLPAGARSAEAWALRSAHSVLVDHFRAAARRLDAATDPEVLAALAPLGEDLSDRPDAGLDAEADAALDAAIVRCMGPRLEALPEEQRDALLATSTGGLSQAEAAQAAGISVAGMKSRVQRGRETVRAGTESCCRVERDARGRPLALHPREGERCSCGCAH